MMMVEVDVESCSVKLVDNLAAVVISLLNGGLNAV